MELINRDTGEKASPELMKLAKQRAIEIFANPYASPEQLEWAIEVYPEGFIEAIILEPTVYTKHRL